MAQSHEITYAHDFLIEEGKVNYYLYDAEEVTNVAVHFDGFVLFSDGPAYITPTTIVTGGGCGGSIEATSIILAIFSLSAIALVIIKKRKEKLGGNL